MAKITIVCKRVKASSILEVVVAMVIIVTVFGLAMMIYANVSRLSLSETKIHAQALLLKQMNSAESGKNLLDESHIENDLVIQQTISNYNGQDSLLVVTLTAYDKSEKKIAEIKRVIINNDVQP